MTDAHGGRVSQAAMADSLPDVHEKRQVTGIELLRLSGRAFDGCWGATDTGLRFPDARMSGDSRSADRRLDVMVSFT